MFFYRAVYIVESLYIKYGYSHTAAATGEIDELLLQAVIGQPDGIAIQF